MAKLPAAKAQAVLIEADKNPALMAKLLERPTSVNKARELMRQINGYMMNAGIEFAYSADDETRPLQRSIDTIAQ
jgi:predicted house-cleaning NTP pyrophosphatase (Maf/HAM1 superfamily)